MTDDNKLLKSITDYLYEQNVRSDCGIESLANDLMDFMVEPVIKQYCDIVDNPNSYFPRTEYDRMCFLLKDIGCKFTTDETMIKGNNLSIEIHPDSMISFGGVSIDFFDDGSFKGFGACE